MNAKAEEPLPENSQDLTVFVQSLLDQMVIILCFFLKRHA